MRKPEVWTWGTVLAALGVVFGDIGTSPLYAFRECFSEFYGLSVTVGNVFGILSLIFWSLILTISVKYLFYVMRADNKGEGGALALMVLALPKRKKWRTTGFAKAILFMGLFGVALLYGDGVITPAISVLSAVEGLRIVTPVFDPFVVPITICILSLLFLAQRFGTAKIGRAFGPVILLWFFVLGGLGLFQILKYPFILQAVSPVHAWSFFASHGWGGLMVLGTIFLVVTGGEALYADMGHFGRKPIQHAWFFVALPGLLLNYFGQGALVLQHPHMAEHPLFMMVPRVYLPALLVLATCASVIASQALISGVFSLTRQAVQLGYFPRVTILQTSVHEIGQVYVPFINIAMWGMTVLLILFFGSSGRLAAAYGVAVVVTMVITTVLMAWVARYRFRMHVVAVLFITSCFLVIDILFAIPNLLKIGHGGWVPLILAVGIMIVMTTWYRGRELLSQRLAEKTMDLSSFMQKITDNPPYRVPGVAVYLTRNPDGIPPILNHNLQHNQVLHACTCLVIIETDSVPYVDSEHRMQVKDLGLGLFRIQLNYGFAEFVDLPAALSGVALDGRCIDSATCTYFLGRETVLATRREGMSLWRERLFGFFSRNAQRAAAFFCIPSNQVVEIGLQIEL